MKEPTQADYEAGRILHQTWYNVARAIAPPFDLIDKFDRLRWIETAKVSNAAQPEQKPVAHIATDALNQMKPPMLALHGVTLLGYNGLGTTAVYTTPPQRPWVGLTDEEMQALWDRYAHMEMMRAIEAKLKEKNA